MADDWLLDLKAACEAGYYKTETDTQEQTSFPWQNRRCRDCPFWINDLCQVDLCPCSADEPPCRYFDPPDYPAARQLIEERLQLAWKQRWKREGM